MYCTLEAEERAGIRRERSDFFRQNYAPDEVHHMELARGNGVFNRPAIASHICKFAARGLKDVATLATVCGGLRETVIGFAPDMWLRVWNGLLSQIHGELETAHQKEMSARRSRWSAEISQRLLVAALSQFLRKLADGPHSYFTWTAVKHKFIDFQTAMCHAGAAKNARLVRALLDSFSSQVGTAEIINVTPPGALCAWILNQPPVLEFEGRERSIAVCMAAAPAASRQRLIQIAAFAFANNDTETPGYLQPPAWSFLSVIFCAYANASTAVISALERFPRRFSTLHPSAIASFGKLLMCRIELEGEVAYSYWHIELCPALHKLALVNVRGKV